MGGIHLHIGHFQNNIHRILCHSVDPQQLPAEYLESEITSHAAELGLASFCPSQEQVNQSEDESVIEPPPPGRGSAQHLTKT